MPRKHIYYVSRYSTKFQGSLHLEIRVRPQDVQRYLEGNISYPPGCVQRSSELQNEILAAIIEAADGMYVATYLYS